MASDKKNTYEGMFLISPAVTADAEKAIGIVKGILDRHQGEIIVIKKWDERKLAYEIKGQKRGLYILAYFKAPGASIAAIERDVNLSDDVLRVLITDASHLNKEEMEAVEPQPVQPREERPSWDRPGAPAGDRGPRREAPIEAAKE